MQINIRSLFFIATLFVSCNVFAQSITVSNISTTGRFNTCTGVGLPVITANFISGGGSSVSGGVLICNDPADSSVVDMTFDNLRWYQGPDLNWIHGVFFPLTPGITVRSTNLSPANWVYMPSGCTGACPTGGNTAGGPGYYYAGPNTGPCCPGGGTTPTPCDNWGDPFHSCTAPLSVGYRLVIKNSILNGSFLPFVLRATADGNTGCWTAGDNQVNKVMFQLATAACPTDPVLCAGGSTTLAATIPGTSYQWQMSTDSVNFTNISDNTNYSGTNTASLTLSSIPSSWYGYQYRCVTDGVNGHIYTLKFVNTWTGAVNSNWNTAGNWSCNAVPDAFTDAIVNSGPVNVTADCSVRSVRVGAGVVFTVNPGINFTVIH